MTTEMLLEAFKPTRKTVAAHSYFGEKFISPMGVLLGSDYNTYRLSWK